MIEDIDKETLEEMKTLFDGLFGEHVRHAQKVAISHLEAMATAMSAINVPEFIAAKVVSDTVNMYVCVIAKKQGMSDKVIKHMVQGSLEEALNYKKIRELDEKHEKV